MNFKTTFALLLLVGLGAGAWWGYEKYSSRLGLSTPAPGDAGSFAVLENELTRANIRRIEISAAGEPLVFEKGKGDVWTLPGKWRTRKGETDELIDVLTNLQSRFVAIPFDHPEPDLKLYGLDPSQHPIAVTVDSEKAPFKILFGDPPQDDAGRFARPTYAQVNGKPEVIRLAPDILRILKRPREYYQRRQLYPDIERVKFAESSSGALPDGAAGPVPLPVATSIALEIRPEKITVPFLLPFRTLITIQPPIVKHALRADGQRMRRRDDVTAPAVDAAQLAAKWTIAEPFVDVAEPERLKSLLTAIPNLWVESFAPIDDVALVAAAFVAAPPDGFANALAWTHIAHEAKKPEWLMKQRGLDEPKYKLAITPLVGEATVLHVGNVSRVRERPGAPPPPARPGTPQMPSIPIREEYRFARLKGQPIMFEVKADKFAEAFSPASALRDERLARFQAKNVMRIEIKQKDATIVLTRDEQKSDKWSIEQPVKALAENDKVTKLIEELAAMEARDADVIDKPNLKETGLEPANFVVTLGLLEEAPGAKKEKKPRTVSFSFGHVIAMPPVPSIDPMTPPTSTNKVHVLVAGRSRINRVKDSVVKLVEQPALVYRGRRVLDFETPAVARLDVKRMGETFALAQADGDWKLAAPINSEADKLKAGDLVGDLGRLEAVEFIADAPIGTDKVKADAFKAELAKAGLDKPELTATIAFSDAKNLPETLLVGMQRGDKPEFFAKLASGTSIFVIKKELRDKLDVGSLDYRPLQLWTLTPDAVTALKIERPGDAFELKREGVEWKVVQPFAATADSTIAMSMVDAVSMLIPLGYQAHKAANLAEFGLDKPAVKIAFTAPEMNKAGVETPRERTVLIGKEVPNKPEVFAKLSDADGVFRVANTILAATNKPAFDLLARHLSPVRGRQITRIERTGKARMTLTKEGKAWKAASGAVSLPADEPTVAAVLETWNSLEAGKFVAYGPGVKLEQFGLKPPVDTLTISLDEVVAGKPVTHVLKLGNLAEGGGRYAQLDDGPGVAVLPANEVKELSRGHLDFADRALLDIAGGGGTIQIIRRVMKGNDMELTGGDGWKIVKPSPHKADETLVQWVKSLGSLRAERVAAYAPGDLKPFGLDAPAASVTVVSESAGKQTPHVIKIGAPTDAKDAKGDRFVMVEGSKIVGVLSRLDAEMLLAEPIAYRDRALVPRRLADPDKVKLQRGERTATFAKIDGTWKMTEPIAAEAEHADLEEFVNAILKLRADEFVAEKPKPEKLKEFGLDKPASTWRFLAADKEVLVLHLGKRDSTDQRVHAKLGTGEMVFLLPHATTTRATSEFRKRAVGGPFDGAQANSLTLGGTAGVQTFQKEEGVWKLAGKPDAKVNQEAINEFMVALAGLKVDHFVRDKDAPKDLYGLGKPRRTITARTATGQVQELHLGNLEGGSKRAYAALPGKNEVFALSEVDTMRLDKEAAAFVEKGAKDK